MKYIWAYHLLGHIVQPNKGQPHPSFGKRGAGRNSPKGEGAKKAGARTAARSPNRTPGCCPSHTSPPSHLYKGEGGAGAGRTKLGGAGQPPGSSPSPLFLSQVRAKL